MIIFVYGTLLKGTQRSPVLSNSRYLGPAVIIKADLFDLGFFPGIREGNGIVIGELYDIDEETLSILDEIEGYNEKHIKNSLFVKRKVRAIKFGGGEYTDAFCYFYNNEVSEEYLIYHGDYRRYLLERENEYQWIVAYGSNMSSKRLIERVGEIKEYKKGFIEGFRLVFNKKAFGEDEVYANIVYTGGDEKCPAVAYKLSSSQIYLLDGYEGVWDHYFRISMPFCDEDGKRSICQTYIANPNKVVKENLPNPKYFNHIKDGYKEHGFSFEKEKMGKLQ